MLRRVLCALAFLATHAVSAEPLHLVHARHTTSTASLRAEVDRLEHAGDTAWIAWTIPTQQPISLGSSDAGIIFLERNGGNDTYVQRTPATEDHAVLLVRVAHHGFGRLRVESPSRTLDAGDLPVVELTSITPEQSLADLRSLMGTTDSTSVRDSLVFAVSLHGSPATIPTLAALAAPGSAADLRERAAFWLGTSTRPAAFAVLQGLARTDQDSSFRTKLTFDLTLSKQPAAADELIRMAHADPSPEVRKQAQFWMANLGGKRLTANLRDDADTDPDTEVRKSAVFALSQLPPDQATPQLIHVATSNTNPEVRKQAVFWLGQSADPHAFDFLTGLLRQP